MRFGTQVLTVIFSVCCFSMLHAQLTLLEQDFNDCGLPFPDPRWMISVSCSSSTWSRYFLNFLNAPVSATRSSYGFILQTPESHR